MPRHFFVLSELPRGATGDVQKQRLIEEWLKRGV